MKPELAITILTGLIQEADQVKREFNKFDGWLAKCRSVLISSVGRQSEHLSSLAAVNYNFFGVCQLGDPTPHHRAFLDGIDTAKEVLQSCIWEIETLGFPNESNIDPQQASAVAQVENLCRKFHAFARQLGIRHAQRTPLEIKDEYDVQDLLHALLRLHFNDIREEEWTPSYAGKSARTDFLLKSEQIVIEVKKTRDGLDRKKVGDELIIDIARYRSHPDCKTLICFVYDPEHRITNPVGLENDLAKQADAISVHIVIAPQ